MTVTAYTFSNASESLYLRAWMTVSAYISLNETETETEGLGDREGNDTTLTSYSRNEM